MDYNRIDFHECVNLLAQLEKIGGRRLRDFKAKIFSDFVTLFFIQAQDNIKVRLKSRDQTQGAHDIFAGAFFGISQVEEQLPARPFHVGTDFLQDRGPNIAHGGEHRPVYEADEIGFPKERSKFVLAKARFDVFPIHLAQRLMLAQHDFAVFKLKCIGEARFGDGMDFGAFGKISKDRVQIGVAEDSKIGNFHPEAGKSVGHDGTVAAKFGNLADEFNVGASACSGGQPRRELSDSRQAQIFFRALALIDDMKDFIDESVETDEGG